MMAELPSYKSEEDSKKLQKPKKKPCSGEDLAEDVATTTEHEEMELLLRDKRRSTWVARANSTGKLTKHDQFNRKCNKT